MLRQDECKCFKKIETNNCINVMPVHSTRYNVKFEVENTILPIFEFVYNKKTGNYGEIKH